MGLLKGSLHRQEKAEALQPHCLIKAANQEDVGELLTSKVNESICKLPLYLWIIKETLITDVEVIKELLNATAYKK